MKSNRLQVTIDEAYEERAYQGQLGIVETREAIRPLERRRQHALAEMVRRSGRCRRAG